jgi:hypothetical protein
MYIDQYIWVRCIVAGVICSIRAKPFTSDQKTMQSFVTHILTPYFDEARARLNLLQPQKALWQINVWSVHCSEEFWTQWMKTHHPNIVINFVPGQGGCTGIHQPCNIGIQQPLKLSLQWSYHEDIVNKVFQQVENGVEALTIDDRIGVLHNRTVRWLWNAHQASIRRNLFKRYDSL